MMPGQRVSDHSLTVFLIISRSEKFLTPIKTTPKLKTELSQLKQFRNGVYPHFNQNNTGSKDPASSSTTVHRRALARSLTLPTF